MLLLTKHFKLREIHNGLRAVSPDGKKVKDKPDRHFFQDIKY